MGDVDVTGDEAHEAVSTSDERPATPPVDRFSQLPTRILPEDMVEEVPADTAKDPDFGRDPDRDWLLRTT
jgi:hypothetical protein